MVVVLEVAAIVTVAAVALTANNWEHHCRQNHRCSRSCRSETDMDVTTTPGKELSYSDKLKRFVQHYIKMQTAAVGPRGFEQYDVSSTTAFECLIRY
jgi:hypothetical protein